MSMFPRLTPIDYLKFLVITGLIYLIPSCANMARPGGGPKDENPPVYVRSTPTVNQLNYSKNKIEIEFDEIIQLDKPSENVVVSPPQRNMPMIRNNGRKITVELKDTLKPNTTYTIDFSDAIADNNEKNVLKNFSLSFSTGNSIDTLAIIGNLLNAYDLEPITGMMIGVHKNLADSAFTKSPFDRIALTDQKGHFMVKNLSDKPVKVYALKDANRDFKFDQPGEDLAFNDSIYYPRMEMKMHTDTVWKDSVTVDTVIMKKVIHYYPDNIILRAFNEGFKSHYLDKSERNDRRKVAFYFTAPYDKKPIVKPLNFKSENWMMEEVSQTNDTLQFWITDSLIYKMDTLKFELDYLKTDSLQRLMPEKDTITLMVKEFKKESSRKKERKPVLELLSVDVEPQSVMDVYRDIELSFPTPLRSIDTSAIHLDIKVDTLWKPVPFTFERDSLFIRDYKIKAKWSPGAEYQLTVDSAAFTGIYGLHSDQIKRPFKVKTLEQYSNLFFNLVNINGPAFVELLNTSDKPVAKVEVKDNKADFYYLEPGKYYARVIEDKDGNGKWSTGNYKQRRQPDMVYYFPQEINLKTNWDLEFEWDVALVPLNKQKPLEITKNKPKDLPKEDNKNKNNNDQKPYNSNNTPYNPYGRH